MLDIIKMDTLRDVEYMYAINFITNFTILWVTFESRKNEIKDELVDQGQID